MDLNGFEWISTLNYWIKIMSTPNTRDDITFNNSWYLKKKLTPHIYNFTSIHLLQMDNHLMNNSFTFTFNETPFISISTKNHVFKWSCSWRENLKFCPIFLLFFSREIWNGSQWHWLFIHEIFKIKFLDFEEQIILTSIGSGHNYQQVTFSNTVFSMKNKYNINKLLFFLLSKVTSNWWLHTTWYVFFLRRTKDTNWMESQKFLYSLYQGLKNVIFFSFRFVSFLEK
jgi:hypothetical protein